MSEQLSAAYRKLFQVHILHHYWLDDGLTLFDLMTEQVKKSKHLSDYDVRDFLTVTPTTATTKALEGLSCVCKNNALGFLVAAPEGTIIPNDALFEWLVTVKKVDFFNYTALTLRNQIIHKLYHPIEKKVYRYKENVPVLSNVTGVARGTGTSKVLFLSQEIPKLAADDSIEALVLSGNVLKQLISDQPGADTKIISSQAKKIPVFVHQGDIPVINPPVGLDGVPQRGLYLSDDIPDTVFALIRLSAFRSGNATFSFVDNAGRAKSTPPLYQIRFINRSTTWQYFDKSNGVFKSEVPEPLPLTFFGNASGSKLKPSAGLPKAILAGTKITRLVSEIFE